MTETVVYKDIKYLTEKTREYLFEMAKGTHALIFQLSIEGINETLAECWSSCNDNKNKNNTNLSQKVAILMLVKECNEAILRLTSERLVEIWKSMLLIEPQASSSSAINILFKLLF